MIKILNQKVIRIEDGAILTCVLFIPINGNIKKEDFDINIYVSIAFVFNNPTKYVFVTKDHISIYGRKAFSIGKIELTNTQRAMLWCRNLSNESKKNITFDFTYLHNFDRYTTKVIEQIFNTNFNNF